MDSAAIVTSALMAAAFAAAFAIVFTAPREYILPTFACGLVAWIVRDRLAAGGLGINWATLLASIAAVLVAATVTRRHVVAPVVLISAIFPLAAGAAVFDAMIEVFRVSTATGSARQEVSAALIGNIGKAFSAFAAIALGLQIGLAIVRLARSRPDG